MEKKKFFVVFFVLAIIVFFFVMSALTKEGKGGAKDPLTLITPATLKTMMETKDFVLINVHIPYDGEIPGTDLFIPYNEIEEKINLPKDKKIVVYCRSGSMSAIAAEKLVAMGFTNVYDLQGGMKAWKQEGFSLLRKT